MADNPLPYGLRWVGSLSGQSGPKPQRVRVTSGWAPAVPALGSVVNVRPGDVVIQLSTGYWDLARGTEGTPGLLGGVVAGFGPVFDGSAMTPTNKFVSGSGVYGTNLDRMSYMWVIPMDGQIFEACCDDAAQTTEAAYLAFIGENANLVFARNTTNANDTSITSLIDISSHAASALQVRLLDLSPRINEDYTGLYVQYKITVNNTQSAPTFTTGI